MMTLHDLRHAVLALSCEEYAEFRIWLREYEATDWDRQIEADVSAGNLDALMEDAVRDAREGRCTDL